MKKSIKKSFHRKKLLLTAVFITGILMFFSGNAYILYQKRTLSFNNFQQQAKPESDNQVGPKPTIIEIPSLNISLPITESYISKDGIWEVSETGASYLNVSGVPGSNTNIVIYGHNKKRLFGPLPRIKANDNIIIQTEDGTKHEYKVQETKIITPDQVSEVLPTQDEVLTIYTCTGFLDSKRFVVKAKPAPATLKR